MATQVLSYRVFFFTLYSLGLRLGEVTFRYQNGQTKQTETRTLSGVEFLRLILRHILPKGYRRARNFGFLHPNSKLIALVQ